MQAEHIHTPNDGRGMRQVFLDGKPIDRVAYADTRRGIVRCYHDPIRVSRWRKRALTYTLHGTVEVKPI